MKTKFKGRAGPSHENSGSRGSEREHVVGCCGRFDPNSTVLRLVSCWVWLMALTS